jgi:hypothetical protein
MVRWQARVGSVQSSAPATADNAERSAKSRRAEDTWGVLGSDEVDWLSGDAGEEDARWNGELERRDGLGSLDILSKPSVASEDDSPTATTT